MGEYRGKSYWEYVEECEGPDIWEYLAEVWQVMREAVERGLDNEGVLPGCLKLRRKAPRLLHQSNGLRCQPANAWIGIFIRSGRQ